MAYDKMFSFLIITFAFFLMFLLIVSVILVLTKPVKQSKQTIEEPKQTRKSNKLEPEDFMITLDWLLTHNIIDTQEYNKLVAKSLPYF